MKATERLIQIERVLEAHTETRVDSERVVFLDPDIGFAVTTDGRRLFASREGFEKARQNVIRPASYRFDEYKRGQFVEVGTGRKEERWQQVIPARSALVDRYSALDLEIPSWLNQLKARSKQPLIVYFYREAKHAGWSIVRGHHSRQVAVNLKYFQPYAGLEVRLLIDFETDLGPIAILPRPEPNQTASVAKAIRSKGLRGLPWFGLVMPIKLTPDEPAAILLSEQVKKASTVKKTATSSPERPENRHWQAVKEPFTNPAKSPASTRHVPRVQPHPTRGMVGQTSPQSAITNVIVTPASSSTGGLR